MKAKHILVGLAVAALLGWGGFRLLRESPEAQVRAAFAALSECLDKNGSDEGPLRTVAKRNDLAALLDDTVSVKVPETGWSGSRKGEEAATRAFAARQAAATLRVRFDDIEVRVAPDGRSASATCDASVSGDSAWGSAEEVREVRTRLVRKDGRWVFSSAEVVPIVRK